MRCCPFRSLARWALIVLALLLAAALVATAGRAIAGDRASAVGAPDANVPAAPPGGAADDDDDDDDDDEDGEGDDEAGKPEAPAEDEDLDEDDEEPPLERAARLIRRGRYAVALKLAGKVEDAEGTAPADRMRAVVLAADALLATGGYDEAIERCEKALADLAASADDVPAAVRSQLATRAGLALRARGRYEDAVKQLRAAFELDDANRLAKIRLAEVLLHDLGARAEAKPLLESFLELYQNADRLTADDLHHIGRACLGLDLFPEVKEEYAKHMYRYVQQMLDEAIEADRRHVESFVTYGRIYHDKFDYPSAKKRFDDALKINPDHAEARAALAATTLASVYGGSGRFAEARTELDRALAINPKLVEAIALDAFIHFTDDQFDQALKRTDEALAINPNDIPTRAVRAAIAFCRGDDDAFAAEQKAVFAVNPAAAAFFVEVARHVVMKFKYEGALELAKKAIAVDKDYWPAYAELGLNAGRCGDEERAYEYLDKAFENDPFNIYAKNQLDVLDLIRRDYETTTTKDFIVRLHKEEATVIGPYLTELLARAREELGKKYGIEVHQPILVEQFPRIEHFSARTIGLPFIGALGACFGKVVTLLSCREERVGQHNWGRTTWHEFAHVVTLQKSGHKVPRWFTEGLSVYEEDRGRAGWGRGEADGMLLSAMGQGKIMGMRELNAGFTKPSGGAQIMLAYVQGGAVCEFIAARWGFAKLPAMLGAYAEGLDTEGVIAKVLEVDLDTFDQGFTAFLQDRYAKYRFRAPATREQLRQLLRAARKNQEDPELCAKLALAYLDHGKRADADIWSNRALKNDEDNGDAFLVRGLLFLRKDNLEAARDRLEKALASETSDPLRAHLALGHIYGRKADSKKALEHLVAARDCFPRDANLHRRVVKAAEAAGEEELARAAREAIVAIDPTDIDTRMELIAWWGANGETEKVRAAAEDIIYVDPFRADVHFLLGEALNTLKKEPKQAIREFEMAIALEHPDRGGCDLGIARAALMAGDNAKAAEHAKKILEFDPENAEAKAILEEAGGK